MITGVHLSLTNITITLNYSGKPEEYTEVRIKIILFRVGYVDMLTEMIKKFGLQLCVSARSP